MEEYICIKFPGYVKNLDSALQRITNFAQIPKLLDKYKDLTKSNEPNASTNFSLYFNPLPDDPNIIPLKLRLIPVKNKLLIKIVKRKDGTVEAFFVSKINLIFDPEGDAFDFQLPTPMSLLKKINSTFGDEILMESNKLFMNPHFFSVVQVPISISFPNNVPLDLFQTSCNQDGLLKNTLNESKFLLSSNKNIDVDTFDNSSGLNTLSELNVLSDSVNNLNFVETSSNSNFNDMHSNLVKDSEDINYGLQNKIILYIKGYNSQHRYSFLNNVGIDQADEYVKNRIDIEEIISMNVIPSFVSTDSIRAVNQLIQNRPIFNDDYLKQNLKNINKMQRNFISNILSFRWNDGPFRFNRNLFGYDPRLHPESAIMQTLIINNFYENNVKNSNKIAKKKRGSSKITCIQEMKDSLKIVFQLVNIDCPYLSPCIKKGLDDLSDKYDKINGWLKPGFVKELRSYVRELLINHKEL